MTEAIQNRYGALAESSCCLSCGSTVAHIDAQPGQVCLDLGSGRGSDVLRLAERVAPGGHAYGVDITDQMLEAARRTARKLGVMNATFLRAELTALPLESASVDWVTSNCVRVLKPGGRFVVSDIYAVAPIAQMYQSDPEAIAECWAGAVTKHEYLEGIASAGLGHIEILEESVPYQKGHAEVASFTIAGARKGTQEKAGTTRSCCCRS
jgi:arsenite methyltransferase